ncbi:semaphorin-1a-like protein [Apostichopus japonicus]|uniref:Semaphorin-1a-like protein n=1 Tax=Stichopus japonicus TaxID=307972 RepID=A0A2G8KU59_STIJA|nr:semaphorin-1a-like protein [Apostichopus japonicus]
MPYRTIRYNAVRTMPYGTMQYRTVPYRTVPYCTMLCRTMPYRTMPYGTAVPYNAILCNAVPYNAIPYSAVQYNAVQYRAVQSRTEHCRTVQCRTVQYRTVQCRTFSCENHISVIEEVRTNEWLICGSNAQLPCCWNCNSTSPKDWTCALSSIGKVENFVPAHPDFDSTWYFNSTENGGLTFAGTEVESHNMPFFSKLDDVFSAIATTNPNNENWLNTPAFVGKPIVRGEYIYFFFRETATEYKNAGKVIYPRVGRVCADNEGTLKVGSIKDFFQTFVKARLNCSIDLSFPFYFNEIQDTYFEGEEPEIVYAVFTTPREGPPASAVCAYSMAEIEAIFDRIGEYKGQASTNADWLPSTNQDLGSSVRFGQCGHKYPQEVIPYLSSHNLIDELVPNLRNVRARNLGQGSKVRTSDSPLLYYNNYRFSSIVKVDGVDGVDGGGVNEPIVFMIGTDNFRILKAAYNPDMDSTEYGSVITEIVLDATYNEDRVNEVRDMVKIQREDGTYVIATAISHVFTLPKQFCDIYTTCEECRRVKDPHCTWDDHKLCHYNGYLVSDFKGVEACVISKASDSIDQVKTFGTQRFSTNSKHSLNFYALLVASKGSNMLVKFSDLNEAVWNSEVSRGATLSTEYCAIRLTLRDGQDTPSNVSISVNNNAIWLNTSIIEDSSDVLMDNEIKDLLQTYDSDLARYEYEAKKIRQEILRNCEPSNSSAVLMCPGFRFEEDNDSFTCPA